MLELVFEASGAARSDAALLKVGHPLTQAAQLDAGTAWAQQRPALVDVSAGPPGLQRRPGGGSDRAGLCCAHAAPACLPRGAGRGDVQRWGKRVLGCQAGCRQVRPAGQPVQSTCCVLCRGRQRSGQPGVHSCAHQQLEACLALPGQHGLWGLVCILQPAATWVCCTRALAACVARAPGPYLTGGACICRAVALYLVMRTQPGGTGTRLACRPARALPRRALAAWQTCSGSVGAASVGSS